MLAADSVSQRNIGRVRPVRSAVLYQHTYLQELKLTQSNVF